MVTEEDDKADEPISLKVDTFPQYDAVLQSQMYGTLSYWRNLVDPHTILTFPTRLESTTLILTLGKDLYLSRLAPENGFDLLQEDFSYGLLFVGILALTFSGYFLKGYI